MSKAQPKHTPPARWEVQGFTTVLTAGGAEITLKMLLPREEMDPLWNKGLEGERQLREQVLARLRASAEYTGYAAANIRLEELLRERKHLEGVAVAVEEELARADVDSARLAQLGNEESDAARRLSILSRALGHAERIRQDRLAAVHRAAVALAGQLRGEVLTAWEKTKAQGAGIFAVAGEQLANLVESASLAGAVGGPIYDETIAGLTTQALCGSLPPVKLPVDPTPAASSLGAYRQQSTAAFAAAKQAREQAAQLVAQALPAAAPTGNPFDKLGLTADPAHPPQLPDNVSPAQWAAFQEHQATMAALATPLIPGKGPA